MSRMLSSGALCRRPLLVALAAGAQSFQIVAVDRVGDLIQLALQALAVREVFGGGEEHVNGAIEFLARARHVAGLVEFLAGFKVVLGSDDAAIRPRGDARA